MTVYIAEKDLAGDGAEVSDVVIPPPRAYIKVLWLKRSLEEAVRGARNLMALLLLLL